MNRSSSADEPIRLAAAATTTATAMAEWWHTPIINDSREAVGAAGSIAEALFEGGKMEVAFIYAGKPTSLQLVHTEILIRPSSLSMHSPTDIKAE